MKIFTKSSYNPIIILVNPRNPSQSMGSWRSFLASEAGSAHAQPQSDRLTERGPQRLPQARLRGSPGL